MNQLRRCFRDCSLDHKITLKEFRQSLKCLEEGKSSASSFDRLADKDIDKGEAEPCFADLAWVPLLSPPAIPLVTCRAVISFLGTDRVRVPRAAGTS